MVSADHLELQRRGCGYALHQGASLTVTCATTIREAVRTEVGGEALIVKKLF